MAKPGLTNRLEAVQYYLNNRTTLKDTALSFKIHYVTLFKWIGLYKKYGKAPLLSTYKRPWNRSDSELEEKIALLKEQNPGLTVRKASEMLQIVGTKISVKGIWGIWKRYGYAGFRKENISANFTEHCSWTKESTRRFNQAQQLFNLKDVRLSAEILNSIPALPQNELITQVPDSLLALRRRVEKIALLFGQIPLPAYQKQVRSLYEDCKRKNLCYSALRMGILASVVSTWHETPDEQLERIKESKVMFRQQGINPSTLFFPYKWTLFLLEGIAYANLSQIKKASSIAKYCSILLERRKCLSPELLDSLGTLYLKLEDFRKAEHWYLRAQNCGVHKDKKISNEPFTSIYLNKGDYNLAINNINNTSKPDWGYQSRKLFCQTMLSLIEGRPDEAISLSFKALSFAKKEELNSHIIRAYITIASAYCSLGEKSKAVSILRRILPFTQKRLDRVANVIKIFLSPVNKDEFRDPLIEDLLPTVKLAYLVKQGDYQKALFYAQRKYLMTYIHRYVFFYPDAIIKLLEKGKPTGLPKAVLRLPIFNKQNLVYNIRLLGNVVVYQNQQYLRSKLKQKDNAFLINLVLRIKMPGTKVSLQELYDNFWKDSPHPATNLSHLLVRLKKTLMIPTHLLEISRRYGRPCLINQGIHFITDYGEFEQIFATANAFLRTDEWGFARKEYLRAFKLFRGEPFRKMYDQWSEDMRHRILTQLENEAIHFAKSCLGHGNKKAAKKVLSKVLQIIPGSEEIKSQLKSL